VLTKPVGERAERKRGASLAKRKNLKTKSKPFGERAERKGGTSLAKRKNLKKLKKTTTKPVGERAERQHNTSLAKESAQNGKHRQPICASQLCRRLCSRCGTGMLLS
jgi:hypothetical protein